MAAGPSHIGLSTVPLGQKLNAMYTENIDQKSIIKR